MNPHYDYKELGLEMLTYDQPDMSYEFNTLCFWSTDDGRVYSASDSGCSCPTPFEDYEGNTLDEVLQNLERIGSVSQGESVFDAWNKDYDNRSYLAMSERQELSVWLSARLKS